MTAPTQSSSDVSTSTPRPTGTDLRTSHGRTTVADTDDYEPAGVR